MVLAGNTTHSPLIRQANDDMRDWTLARVMWVADRGFSSAQNRRELRRGGGHYIIGEKLRSGSAEATAALSRQGRYSHVRDNLQVKEVRIAEDERFVICHNPEQGDRDPRCGRTWSASAASSRAPTPGARRARRTRGQTQPCRGCTASCGHPAGLLRVDQAAVRAEAHLDGKYLLRTSDPTCPPMISRWAANSSCSRVSTLPEVPGGAPHRLDAVVAGSGVVRHADDTGAEILDFVHDP